MKFLFIPVLALFLVTAKDCSIPNPKPTPTPVPTPTPTPEPTPTPTPIVSCTFPQGVLQEDYKLVANPKQYQEVVNQVIRENVATCAGDTDCTWGPENPQHYITVVANALIEKGLCAGQHENGVTDQVSVASGCQAGITWENYYVVNFGGTQHKARFNAPGDGWQVPVSCGSTTPVPELKCNDFTGFRDIKKQTKVGNRININTTPEGCNRDKCNALGWTGRNCCPVGSRETQRACEDKLVGSAIFTLLSDNPVASVNSLYTNPDVPMLGIMKVTDDFISATIKVCGEKSPNTCSNGVIQ